MNSQTEYSVDARRAALRKVRAALEARIAERIMGGPTLPLATRWPATGNREFGIHPHENEREPHGD